MDRSRLTRRIALYGLAGLAGLAGLLVLVAVALRLFVDPGAHKPRLEAMASLALGMQVDIEGGIAFDLLPAVRLTLADVRVGSKSAGFMSARRATIAVDWLSLFGQDLRIERVVLEQPTVAITRQRDGRFNVEPPPAAGETSAAKQGPDVSFTDATFTYVDDRFGKEFVARDCRGNVRQLRHAGGPQATRLGGLSFSADLRCGEVLKDGYKLSDLVVKVDAKDGVLAMDPFTVRVFDAPGKGSVRADFSVPLPSYAIDFDVLQFPVEAFFRTASLKPVATGRMDFSARLSTRGKTVKELRQALQGTLSLRGKGLVFSGGDLDLAFDRFESSQTFDLVDVGAVFFAGPLGLLVTKGYDFATLAQRTEGRSEIRTLVSEWKVTAGVAQARDVAMATARNRVALQGRLDLVNDRFDDVTLAMVDAKGCATVRQRIRGTFQAPVVEPPNVLESLAGPALRLLRRGSDLLRGQGCDVFYAGSVAAPK